MNEEIFGPILPVISIESIEEAEQIIKKGEKLQLGMYLFTSRKTAETCILNRVSFGGGCVMIQ